MAILLHSCSNVKLNMIKHTYLIYKNVLHISFSSACYLIAVDFAWWGKSNEQTGQIRSSGSLFIGCCVDQLL